MNAYVEEILKPRPLADRPGLPDFSYMYAGLIWDYPKGEFTLVRDGAGKLMRVDWPIGNGHGGGTNQVDYVVNKLVNNPTSRRCVITLFEPRGHPLMDDPPCLNHIQFMLRNGELNMHALFRSNDMLSAWGANAYALAHFQREVLRRLKEATGDRFDSYEKISLGWMETTSISAHIYFKRDKHEADQFRGFY